MDNYTPDPFWNNNQNDVQSNNQNDAQNNVQNDIQNINQDSAGNNNSTPGYGSYSDNYSNNPNQPYNNNGNVYGNPGNSYNNGYNNNYNNGYNNNGYNNYYYGGNGNQQNNCPNFTLMLVFCILSILFLSKIVGAIALVFLFQANNNFRYGYYDKYESNIKICKILLVVSVVVGIFVFIGSMAIGFSTSGLFSMM